MDKTYRILNYTRIKPRSRPPQKKKIRIFYALRFFSGQNRKKKESAQITRANTVCDSCLVLVYASTNITASTLRPSSALAKSKF